MTMAGEAASSAIVVVVATVQHGVQRLRETFVHVVVDRGADQFMEHVA